MLGWAEPKSIITQETQGERRERGGHLDGMLIVITVLVGCRHSNLSHRWSQPDHGGCVYGCVCDNGETGDSDVHKLTIVRVQFQHPALTVHSSFKQIHTAGPLQDIPPFTPPPSSSLIYLSHSSLSLSGFVSSSSHTFIFSFGTPSSLSHM